MVQAERIVEYLQQLTPLTRSNLLSELERMELCGIEMPGMDAIVELLRTEFPKGEQAKERMSTPSRYFFAPLEPLLTNGDPDSANAGRIPRGSLSPIWEWVSRDLLPTMARDYAAQMKELIAADKQRQARQVTAAFQTKVAKSLQSTLGSPEGSALARAKLAAYTASRSAFDDLAKIMSVLAARDALAKFDAALPESISKFDEGKVARIAGLLDRFREANPEALTYALTLVAGRLKTPWQLIRLATKAAASKNAADVAATPYAITVSMALDCLDDKRLALRFALKQNRVLVAKELLTKIYDTEYALQVRIDQLETSEWGLRLRSLMDAIAALVEAEVSRFPEKVGHVLGSRSLRSHQSLTGRLTYLAWKGRDVVHNGAAICKRLIG
jgi:hypothetical protein